MYFNINKFIFVSTKQQRYRKDRFFEVFEKTVIKPFFKINKKHMKTLIIGKTISAEVSYYLKEYTTAQDIADVNSETGISTSTLNYVKRRAGNVSEENKKGIISLAKRAYDNAEAKRKEALRCKKELSLILQS